MGNIDYLKRIREIDRLIKTKSTGNTTNFAMHLGISKSQLHDDLKTLRELGAPIFYSRIRQTYYYKYLSSFSLFFTPILNDEQAH